MPLLVVFRVFCNKSVFAMLAFPGLQAYSVRRDGLRRFVKARPQLVLFYFYSEFVSANLGVLGVSAVKEVDGFGEFIFRMAS